MEQFLHVQERISGGVKIVKPNSFFWFVFCSQLVIFRADSGSMLRDYYFWRSGETLCGVRDQT